MPALVGGFGNYLLPVMIGAPDYGSIRLLTTSILPYKQFGIYLAGLWEGDGSVWIPKNSHSPTGKRYTPHFTITFNEHDYPLVIALQLIIGGTIRHKSANHAYVLTISSINGLHNIVNLINGYLRTPKIGQFNKLIEWLNNNSSTVSKGFIFCHDVDNSNILNNAWLSGFIDADGSFDVKVREKSDSGKGKNRVEARARIEQRQIDPNTGLSYALVLDSIAKAFNVVLNTSIHNGDMQYYIIAITSPAKLKILIQYLDTYPLFSSKLLNYQDFKNCVNLMLNRKHLTIEGREQIKIIKAGMNSKRTHYNWSHLDKLSEY